MMKLPLSLLRKLFNGELVDLSEINFATGLFSAIKHATAWSILCSCTCVAISGFATYVDPAVILTAEQQSKIKDPGHLKYDIVVLKDGSILQGKITVIPPIKYSFGGTLQFKRDEVALINIYQTKRGAQLQYAMRSGEVFVGQLPQSEPIIFTGNFSEYDAKTGTHRNKYGVTELKAEQIDYIRFKKNSVKYLASKDNHVSLIMKNGDRFVCNIENYAIELCLDWKNVSLPVRKIVDIRVRQGGLVGTIKNEAVSMPLQLSHLRDHYITVRLLRNKQRLVLPWAEIDRVIADKGQFIKSKAYRVSYPEYEEMVYVPAGKFIFGFDVGGSAHEKRNDAIPPLIFEKSLSENSKRQALLFQENMDETDFTTIRGPATVVNISAFYVDKYNVTNADYYKFVEATGHRAPAHWIGGEIPPGLDNHPVVNVSYLDAAAYAKWAGKRLPTEIEWERVAKWGHGYNYPYGDRYNPHLENTEASTTLEIGNTEHLLESHLQLLPQDLSGNVSEWTSSVYIDNQHEILAEKNSQIHLEQQTVYVTRGGSYVSSAEVAKASYRGFMYLDDFNPYTGFRCVKDIESPLNDYMRAR
ncbi:MAG: hypothetical protein K0S74_1092 [Chlamydiales bacterium]|jgi:formylglycine-generating enzyme required for sulfatase activity|nr:hypothetical protein [Chlamydiales bacterium]